ncbi:Hypothetical protein R9X50_00635100 [Acrodontium crateriforme]|uniref:ferroxidase n=1 Tax=Acrodontium crateriforme TaxID=150365 RepID=A0AAQ3R6R4_9PEZI|nr:Hypothetical protein R9X50_00635100 [Acrodontium crateriforme]
MSSPVTSRLARAAGRYASGALTRRTTAARFAAPIRQQMAQPVARYLATSSARPAGLMPDTPDPKPPQNADDGITPASQPTEITEDEYHRQSDLYLNNLVEQAELLQESREDVEVEFSAGVLSLTFPPNGTYVINKQPPNKQIWLSSPLSGPKRFDWVVIGESMHEKEGGGLGDWVYLRDNSSLTEILRKEVGITVDATGEKESLEKQSVDPTE